MSPLRTHLQRSVFVIVAPALVVVGCAFAISNSFPQVASHADIANTFTSAVAVLAPVLAGFAAWDGLRERRHGGGPVLETAAQPHGRILLVQLCAGMVFALFVVVSIVGALYIRASLLVLADSPRVLIVVTTMCTALGFTAFGYLVAYVMRHWSAVLVAAVPPALIYATSLLTSGVSLMHSVIPFGNRAGGDFLDINEPFFVGQLLAIAGVLAALVGSIAITSHRDRLLGFVAMLVAVSSIWGGVALINATQQRWGTPVADVDARLVTVVSDDGALRLHVLPTYLPVAEDLLTAWRRVQVLFSDTPAAFSTLSQNSNSHPSPGASPGKVTTVYLNPTSRALADDSVMESVLDVHTAACQGSGTFETSLVELWITGSGSSNGVSLTADDAELLNALNALSADEGADWLAKNFDSFANCTITRDAFPVK